MNYKFLKYNTELAFQINVACNELFVQIANLDVEALDIEPYFKEYFKRCHFTRQYFTLETSAKLLYDSLVLLNKPHTEVSLMDYGAGIGTLYILAKRIGVKQVIYNDYLPGFTNGAMVIDKALGIKMDVYVTGDVDVTCEVLKEKNIELDLVLSRNVIEHIYNLQCYFETLHRHQPKAILYNSTTANWRNPAAHIQHVLIHKKNKPVMVAEKKEYILKNLKGISEADATSLATNLISIGSTDFTNFVKSYTAGKPTPQKDYTNICNLDGTWCEHLIPYKQYIKFAHNYNVQFLPGIWDVNYSSVLKRTLGKILNFATKILGKNGVYTSSYFYVVCLPK